MDNNFTKLEKLTDIDQISYEGYIWKSDESKPKILNNGTYDFTKIGINPFIVEGFLYSKDENFSISIRQIDGKYYITKIDLKDLNFDSDNLVEHKYLSDATIIKQNRNFKYIKFMNKKKIIFWTTLLIVIFSYISMKILQKE